MNEQALDLRHTLAWLLLFAAAVFASMFGTPYSDVREVDVAEAKALVDAGALVIDVRSRAVSASSHLPGALPIPLETLTANLWRIEAARPGAIVVYCGDGSTRGPEGARILTDAGFIQTVNLKAGIEAWRRAGLPTSES